MSNDEGREVFLVRHGEAAASWGQSADPGLSSLGQTQAQEAAGTLKTLLASRMPSIVSSPLKRARETAEPLARHFGLEPVIDDRFREVPSPSPLSGRQDWLRSFMRSRWSEQDAGLLAWRRAMLEALDTLPDGSVVFSHFLVLNTLVGAQEKRDETLLFWPANASITVFRQDGEGAWSVRLGQEMASRVN